MSFLRSGAVLERYWSDGGADNNQLESLLSVIKAHILSAIQNHLNTYTIIIIVTWLCYRSDDCDPRRNHFSIWNLTVIGEKIFSHKTLVLVINMLIGLWSDLPSWRILRNMRRAPQSVQFVEKPIIKTIRELVINYCSRKHRHTKRLYL